MEADKVLIEKSEKINTDNLSHSEVFLTSHVGGVTDAAGVTTIPGSEIELDDYESWREATREDLVNMAFELRAKICFG